jgi:hypothetical protein
VTVCATASLRYTELVHLHLLLRAALKQRRYNRASVIANKILRIVRPT